MIYLEQKTGSQFFGPNLGYVLELYERYRSDPESVDERTREFFETWSPPRETDGPTTNGASAAPGIAPEVDVEKAVGASKHVRHIRDFGHRAAQLDPLGSEPPGDPTLDPSFYRISDEDLETLPPLIIGGPIAKRVETAREAVDELRRIYCKTTGYDFGHVHDPEERFWLREAVESERFAGKMDGEAARRLLKRLTRVETFEQFLHKSFVGQKRFSVEGNDMVVPMLNALVHAAADSGIPEMVLGMAHRGRLNVLAHVLDKPYSRIFSEFQQPEKGESSSADGRQGEAWVGDVKYHLGIRGFQLGEDEADQQVMINLAPNPSHLEHVNPVVEGMARAAQEDRDGAGAPRRDEDASLPVLLHGDAAFPAEGVSAETLNLSHLPGYTTGGTIHIITNNQIGFTTERSDARSTTYASDLAKGFEMPVVHVNADDPEACLAATRMAFAYRERFAKDFMIDLIGYRRFGHNEGDEPAFTQPRMYERIKSHPTVRARWAAELEERGVISEGEADEMIEEIRGRMEEVRKQPPEDLVDDDVMPDTPHTPLAEIPNTSVPAERLRALNDALLKLPEDFKPNERLQKRFLSVRGVISEGEADEMIEEIRGRMEEVRKQPPEDLIDDDVMPDTPHTPLAEIPDTSVSAERLRALNDALLKLPEDFKPNERLQKRFLSARGELEGIDWGHAEALAFASLLEDGIPIRLTGQDTVRGTFSQRHAGLYDRETGERYVPLQNIPQATASFAIHNSPLSEIAVLGFEYGYSVNSGDTLVLWEAQYGDFANVAQPVIDQFVVSGQVKWGQTSGLVMLLPHGYEGQGPEHSSARLERFLELAANENIRVVNLTTAAQYFHLLRAQATLQDNRRPLVVMAPKSLLRHPLAASKLEDLSEGGFMPVIDDAEADVESIERLILCSGKIYTELAGSELREEAQNVALARVELLYPFPEGRIREAIERYPNLEEVVWLQEEPKNMGAWTYMEPRLRDLLGGELPLRYLGKPARPNPAQGSSRFHKQEHAEIVQRAFVEDDQGEGEAAAASMQERAPTASE